MKNIGEAGRSMVEILGVLAIVGVLSIGGMIGYAKAMEMHRINKWKSDFSWLITNIKMHYLTAGQYAENDYNATKQVILNSTLKQYDIIPNNFFVHSTKSADKDFMYNTIEISNKYKKPWGSRLTFRVTTQKGDTSIKTCNLLYNMAYQFGGIWYVGIDGSTKGTGYCSTLAPDSFWTDNQCKSFPVTMADVATVCTKQCKNSCTVIVILDNAVL